MSFAVPAPKSSTDAAARFEFTLPGSKKKWRVPLFGFMPVSEAEKVAAAMATKKLAPVVDVLFGAKGEPLADAIHDLTPDQINALVTAWSVESGLTLGESKASSNS